MKIPTRLQTATRAFFAILWAKPHVYCDNKHRSINGTTTEFQNQMLNLLEIHKRTKETNAWMANVKEILNEKI